MLIVLEGGLRPLELDKCKAEVRLNEGFLGAFRFTSGNLALLVEILGKVRDPIPGLFLLARIVERKDCDRNQQRRGRADRDGERRVSPTPPPGTLSPSHRSSEDRLPVEEATEIGGESLGGSRIVCQALFAGI